MVGIHVRGGKDTKTSRYREETGGRDWNEAATSQACQGLSGATRSWEEVRKDSFLES